MNDCYTPKLADFAFEAAEQELIVLALASEKPWDYKAGNAEDDARLDEIKEKILSFHLERHGWTCCYCKTNLHGAGPFMTDREHILPKGKASYKALSYTLWNLAAACKRCNMQFKRSGDGFVINGDDPAALLASGNYRFVHPNFDLWGEHLTRVAAQVNERNIVKILRRGTDKADYAYDFFHLQELEVDSFDAAQGLSGGTAEGVAAIEFLQIAANFGQ